MKSEMDRLGYEAMKLGMLESAKIALTSFTDKTRSKIARDIARQILEAAKAIPLESKKASLS